MFIYRVQEEAKQIIGFSISMCIMTSRIKNSVTIIIGIIAVAVTMSFTPSSGRGKLVIRFQNFVGDRRLALDTASYVNTLGQVFTVTNFKYYISNIELEYRDKKLSIHDPNYYLVRQDDDNSWTLELNDIPDGDYRSIHFMIGVDSLRNCSGAQSGALDPINGMFWTWNTGYIFMKLEGKSPASRQPGHIFEYHIGGYKEPTNFIRTTSLDFGGEGMKMLPGKTTTIYIKADVAKILHGKNQIDFAKMSSVTDFHNSDKIADNYSSMFSIIRISNEW
jgi:hypothetical protein